MNVGDYGIRNSINIKPEAAVILSTEPLWVALFSYLLLRESFNANDLIGGSLVIAACFVSALENVNDKSINDGTNDDNDNQEPDVEETCEIEQDGFMISRVAVVGVRWRDYNFVLNVPFVLQLY